MTTDRFNRYLGELLGDLAEATYPAYLDAAIATASARPQRRPSLLPGLWQRSTTGTGARGRFAPIAVPILVATALLVALVASPYFGAPDGTPAPTPQASASPVTTAGTPASGQPGPATSISATCPGHVPASELPDPAATPGLAEYWSAGGIPTSLEPGHVAAYATNLVEAPVAVVLIDPSSGATCRLVDLEERDQPYELAWAGTGDALAISTSDRLLLWSSLGVTQPWRPGPGSTGPISIAWSPDASQIAIGRPGQNRLVVFHRNGLETTIALEGVTEMAWSPDGIRLAVTGVDWAGPSAGANRTTIITFASPPKAQLLALPDELAWAPVGWLDSETLILGDSVLGDGAYTAVDVPSLTASSWVTAAVEPLSGGSRIGYASDVSAVAILGTTGQDGARDLIVRSLPEGESRIVAAGLKPSGVLSSGAWAPDSTAVAVAIDAGPGDPRTGLWIFALDGAEPIQLSPLAVRISDGAWRPRP